MASEEEIRWQLIAAYEGADYPVNSPMELVPGLPEGPETEFSSGDFSITAMELNTQADVQWEFPYESVNEFVDDILEGIKNEFSGHFEDPGHFHDPSRGNLPDWFRQQHYPNAAGGQSADDSGDTELYSEGEDTEMYSKGQEETEIYTDRDDQSTPDFSYCPSCGEKLSGSPSFCKYCGQDLSEY